MASIHPIRPEPPALHDRAADNLRFIRETMAKAAAFTAVPGWALMAWAPSAPLTAYFASRQVTTAAWLTAWLVEATLSILVLTSAMAYKAKHARQPLSSGPGQKFVQGVVPPFVSAAALTAALAHGTSYALMPGLWLLLYGAGVVAGGASSVKLVPAMGASFMVLGLFALLTPAWGDLWMALGFGGLHAVYGLAIARRHGG